LVSEEIYKEIRMPTLTLKLSQSLSENALEVLAASLTKITHDLLGKRKELTALMIETLPSKQWFIGGVPISEPTAWLEISISPGFNEGKFKFKWCFCCSKLCNCARTTDY
jgi:phenylpyruvate tautomerase PptA (4-oxalocrotonate tautomerase family)